MFDSAGYNIRCSTMVPHLVRRRELGERAGDSCISLGHTSRLFPRFGMLIFLIFSWRETGRVLSFSKTFSQENPQFGINSLHTADLLHEATLSSRSGKTASQSIVNVLLHFRVFRIVHDVRPVNYVSDQRALWLPCAHSTCPAPASVVEVVLTMLML